MYKVYILKCPIENIPRYIGITKQDAKIRFYNHFVSEKFSKNPRKYRWIQKLKSLDLKPEMIVLIDGLTKEQAESFEIKLIQKARELYPNRIVNICNGGNCPTMTDSVKQKISDALKTNNVWKGRKHSDESKKKMSQSRIGLVRSMESRKKQSIAIKGISKSEEHKRKISESNKGKKFSDATKEKMRIASRLYGLGSKKGVPKSEEHKKKLALINRSRGKPLAILDTVTGVEIKFENKTDAINLFDIDKTSIYRYVNKEKLFKGRYKVYDIENKSS